MLQNGADRDWLYIVHMDTGKDKGNWRSGGPLLPELDRALQDYSYDIIELQVRTAKVTKKQHNLQSCRV